MDNNDINVISKEFADEIKAITEYQKNIKTEVKKDKDILWIESDKDDFCEEHYLKLYAIYVKLINFYNKIGEEKYNIHKEIVKNINNILNTNYQSVDLSSHIENNLFIIKLFLYKE